MIRSALPEELSGRALLILIYFPQTLLGSHAEKLRYISMRSGEDRGLGAI